MKYQNRADQSSTQQPVTACTKSYILRLFIVCLALFVPHDASADDKSPNQNLSIPESSYDWWREARLGIFIHWNASSVLQLGEGSWSRKNPTAEGHDYHKKGLNKMERQPPEVITGGGYRKYLRQGGVPMAVYDNLFHVFNPKDFDADAWVRTFKDAGAGYIIFTTKHHDGFCMFDSKFTDYDIMSTPFARDIAKELSAACHRQGIRVIWYYSRPDWFDPRHDTNNPAPYAEYLTNQVTELLTNYGPISGIWWDSGQIEVPTRPLFDKLLRLQPGLISNGRIQSAKHHVPGKSFGTPEQEIGAFKMTEPWESCVTMMADSWFWNGGKDIRTPESCIRLLVNCACGDGNLALDFGPDELGRIHPEVQASFAGLGAWFKTNAASIRGTRGGPYMPDSWGGSTRHGSSIYLHITQASSGEKLRLPPLPKKIQTARLLRGSPVTFSQDADGVIIELKPELHDPLDTIVELTVEGDAMSIEPIPARHTHWDSLTVNAKVTASSSSIYWAGMSPECVVLHSWEKGAPKAIAREAGTLPKHLNELVDRKRGHIWRTWTAADDDAVPWIEIDFGKPVAFDTLCLREKFTRIRAFQLQVTNESAWQTIHEGKDLDILTVSLPTSITTAKVRLLITDWVKAKGEKFSGPGIQEFDVFRLGH